MVCRIKLSAASHDVIYNKILLEIQRTISSKFILLTMSDSSIPFSEKIHPRANAFLEKLIKEEYDGKKTKIEMYAMFLKAKRDLLKMDKNFKISPLTDEEYNDERYWDNDGPYIEPHLAHLIPLKTYLMLIRSHGYKVQYFQ